jgi:hypothetical protein
MIKKAYSTTGRSCRVIFELPPEVNAQTACLCGEFNEPHEAPRGRELHPACLPQARPAVPPVAQQCRFRYLLDGERWENDWTADAYVPNSFGSDDSVVEV